MAPATGAKNSQPGKMVASPVRVADVGEEFGGLFAAFEGCACSACAGEAGVDGGEDAFR